MPDNLTLPFLLLTIIVICLIVDYARSDFTIRQEFHWDGCNGGINCHCPD